ncbi:MAG: hypothetical protein LLG20_11065 [Acidobacteriales bacterium]|nr:hypothetical protein [Terriglobales bacterium]
MDQQLLILSALLVGFLLLLLLVFIKACINDARRRGKSPLLVCIAVFGFFPWGLIAWILFRPEPVHKSM